MLLGDQTYIAKGRAVRKGILAVLIYGKWNSFGRSFGGAFRPQRREWPAMGLSDWHFQLLQYFTSVVILRIQIE